MAAVAHYLADTSALARLHHPEVAAVLAPLIESGVVATCGVIEFELGWATRSSAEFDQVRADRDAGYEWLATHDEDWRRGKHSVPHATCGLSVVLVGGGRRFAY
jgi:predicted nucleic acid-binding protein